MSRQRALDAEGRTLLIGLWKAKTTIQNIVYILNVSAGTVYREIRELRDLGLIPPRATAKKKKPPARPKSDNTDPRHNRAMRKCLRCPTHFNSSWIGNRLCKNCLASASGGRAIN